MTCGDDAQCIRAEVLERGKIAKQALVDRFEKAKADGDLPAHVDIAGLTSFLFAVMQGMSVQAGSGATREELERLIDTSLLIWPTASGKAS